MKADSPASRTAPVLVPMPAETPYTYCSAARHEGRAGLDRARAARTAPGGRHRLGRRWRRGRSAEAAADSSRSSTARRSTSRCAASSTGSPPTRCRRPAWWRACCCERRRPSIPEPWIEGLQRTAERPDRMTPARSRVLETRRRRACLDAFRPGACRRRVVDRHRRLESARRVRAGDDPAATGRARHPTRAMRSPT